jgi:ABC-type phosphate transport system substrate-binding protein
MGAKGVEHQQSEGTPMTNTKIRALAGASLLLGAGLAASAQAQVTAQVYGGGSSLSAPYVRQAEDCFGARAPLFTPGAAASDPTPGTYQVNVAGVPTTTNCSTTQVDPSAQFFIEASGSGAGVLAFFQHNPNALGSYTDTDGTTGHFFPAMHYATSDTAMGSAGVGVYNGGGVTEPATGKSVNVVAPGVSPGAGQFANPAATYGAMVQIPLLITPITVPFSPVYKKVVQGDGTVKSYSFNFTYSATKHDLRLDLVTYCKIFNGQITDWNDPAIAALNGKAIKKSGVLDTTKGINGYTPIYDPTDPDVDPANPKAWSLPIELVGRADGSGTTSIFTRALAAQCDGLAGVTNKFADATSTLPGAVLPASQPAAPGSGQFTTKSGSGGVAGYLKFADPTGAAGTTVRTGKIAYLSPDYVGPVNTSYGLVYAALQNYDNAVSGATPQVFVLPLASKAAASFGSVLPPSGADAADPSKWVQAPSKAAAIATPHGTGYPIVGTTQILVYTCYQDAGATPADNIGYKMNQFLKFYVKNPMVAAGAITGTPGSGGILALNGFAPMPGAWKTAEYNTFVLPSASNPLYVSSHADVLGPKLDPVTHLQIIKNGVPQTKVVWAHNTACNAVTGG